MEFSLRYGTHFGNCKNARCIDSISNIKTIKMQLTGDDNQGLHSALLKKQSGNFMSDKSVMLTPSYTW